MFMTLLFAIFLLPFFFGHHFVSLENHNQLIVRFSLLRKTSAYFYQNIFLVVYDYEKIFEFCSAPYHFS